MKRYLQILLIVVSVVLGYRISPIVTTWVYYLSWVTTLFVLIMNVVEYKDSIDFKKTYYNLGALAITAGCLGLYHSFFTVIVKGQYNLLNALNSNKFMVIASVTTLIVGLLLCEKQSYVDKTLEESSDDILTNVKEKVTNVIVSTQSYGIDLNKMQRDFINEQHRSCNC